MHWRRARVLLSLSNRPASRHTHLLELPCIESSNIVTCSTKKLVGSKIVAKIYKLIVFTMQILSKSADLTSRCSWENRNVFAVPLSVREIGYPSNSGVKVWWLRGCTYCTISREMPSWWRMFGIPHFTEARSFNAAMRFNGLQLPFD